MPFCYAAMAGLSPTEKLQVLETSKSNQFGNSARDHAWSLLTQKSWWQNPENDDNTVEESTPESETTSPSTRLRKRARVSYAEPTESDIESDADSGYNSDASVEWGSKEKQPKAKRARKEKPVKPFPFLSLPSELRNRIYFLALEDPDGMVMDEGWRAHRRVPKRSQYDSSNKNRYPGVENLSHSPRCYPTSKWSSPHTLSPSLLAVSKQIYAEAAAILYSQPLHFTCATALHSFLAPLSNETASLIHSMSLQAYETYNRGVRRAMVVSALTLLPKCTNLKTMRLEAFDHYFHNGTNWPTPQKAGKFEGQGIARQLYRDAAFWFDAVGAEKALQVLDVSGLQRSVYGRDQKHRDEAAETVRIANVVFAEELTLLINKAGRSVKKGKRSKTACTSD
jgi:hypothetical protein